MNAVHVTPWQGSEPPTQSGLLQVMSDEGLSAYSWSNAPGDVYSAHSHGYDKVIYVVRGSITFGLPEENRKLTLKAGDRLDLPAGIIHNAFVGSDGVLCLEAHVESGHN